MKNIIAKAPLRISFAGGGTDIPSYYMDNGGAVLVSTINRYTFATISPRSDDQVCLRSLDFDLMISYRIDEEPIYDGVLDLAKATVRRMGSYINNRQGFDFLVQSDAPPGSGLGGSASLTTALIGGMADYLGMRLDNYQIAEMAYTIERTDLGISGGKQDQYAITFGGFNLIEFSAERIVVNPLRIPKEILNDLEYHLILCYTGKTRLSAGLIDRQERYYKDKRSDTIEGLNTLFRLTYEMKDALLRGKLGEFAELLDLAWMNKVKMNPHVTDEQIDEIYAVARKSGALGGKLLGAGGGGYLLLFCEIGSKRLIREKLEKLGGKCIDFSFDGDGLQSWRSTCN